MSGLELFEGEHRVGAPKAEGVRERHPYIGLPGYIRDIVQIAPWIGGLIVDRWRNDPAANRQDGEDGLHAAGSAQEVANHGFRRADGQFLGVFFEDRLDRYGFIKIIVIGGRSMGIDVINLRS
jgi:hypothetical protein